MNISIQTENLEDLQLFLSFLNLSSLKKFWNISRYECSKGDKGRERRTADCFLKATWSSVGALSMYHLSYGNRLCMHLLVTKRVNAGTQPMQE